MTKNVIALSPNDDVSKVVGLMADKGINRLPVVDDDEIVGIVARDDLIKAFKK